MSVFTNILLILGFLGLTEGILVSLSPRWTIHALRIFIKKKENIKRAGTIEIIVSIILIWIGINI